MVIARERSGSLSSRIIQEVNAALKSRGLSARRASMDVVGHDGLIRDIRAGRMPSVDRLDALYNYLGLHISLGSGVEGELTPVRFSKSPLPHRGLAKCSMQGWSRAQPDRDPLPAPVWLDDPTAFYVTATGDSMIPEGIPPGTVCLVTPARKPAVGDRVWIRDRSGAASIKRLVAMHADRIELRGWLPRQNDAQRSFEEERFLNYIDELHPVAAVFRNMSGDLSQVELVPDPRAILPNARPAAQLAEIAALDAGADFTARGIMRTMAVPPAWLKAHALDAASCALVHVADTSMAPDIPQNATVLIDKSDTAPTARAAYAIRDGSGILLRYIQPLGSSLLVTAADTTIPPALEAPTALNILGRVAWTGHILKAGD